MGMTKRLNMTWRGRGDEGELPILRGLIDEIVCILDDNLHLPKLDLVEKINKTIWECNNAHLEDGTLIWWPKYEEIDGNLCLIEERLDANKNRIEMRVKHIH